MPTVFLLQINLNGDYLMLREWSSSCTWFCNRNRQHKYIVSIVRFITGFHLSLPCNSNKCVGNSLRIDMSFKASYPTSISTLPASGIDLTSATLNGSVNAGGIPTAVKFEYGTTASYGNVTDAIPDSSSGTASINVNALITSLSPNTTYHFRIKGMTATTTSYGNDLIFYTGNCEFQILILSNGHHI